MFEQVPPPARPRVALVYGDAGRVGHLRDVVADHMEIVYETAAADFNASQLACSRATAALVNLDDDCDWLDPIEARLNEAGVAVVFNDPEISHGLEGWARARWLRHLTAKLIGSSDYDPPRPVVALASQAAAAPALDIPVPVDLPTVDALAITERPLSPTEIESMTANFVAVKGAQDMAANLDDMTAVDMPPRETAEPAEIIAAAETEQASHAAATETLEPLDVPSPPTVSARADNGDAATLDVDTEALSAMIDARLAQPMAHSPDAAPEVWRVIETGNVSAGELDAVDPERTPIAETASANDTARAPTPSLPVDDSDVLNALPSLGDWQLVDPDAPLAPAAGPKPGTRIEPTISLDFADLELVPIETNASVAQAHAEPVERWMHANDDKVAAEKHRQSDANGERA